MMTALATLLQTWREAVRALPRFGLQVVTFQLAFVVLAGALLAPALAWLLDQLIRSTGDYAVSNFDLIGFFLSARGIAFLAGSGSVAAAFLYLELTGLLLITADPAHPVSSLSVLRYGLGRFQQLLRLGLLQLLGLTLVAAPFLAGIGVVKLLLLGAHDINFYLYEQPPEWTKALLISGAFGLAGGAAIAFLLLRWLLALPILLSARMLPWEALRESWHLTRGRTLHLAATLGGWWAASWLAARMAAEILVLGTQTLLAAAEVSYALTFSVVGGFVTVLLAGTLTVSIITVSVSAILINGFYREALGHGLTVPGGLAEADPGRATVLPTRLLSAGIVAAVLLLSAWGIRWVYLLDFRDDVLITAHRGSSWHAPENTLAALRLAIDDGADYAEIDVQTTLDGHVVLLHDRDFMRMSGDPRRLEDLTMAQVRTLDVGERFAAEFAGEVPPTLEEAIAMSRGKMRLNVELKYNRPDPDLAAAVVTILQEEDFVDESIITSLDFASLQKVKRLEPRLKTGLIVTRAVGNPTRLPVDFLSVNRTAVTDRLLAGATRSGKEVHVWTINSPVGMNRMVEAGVDNVITDLPADMRAVLEARAALSPAEKLALQIRRGILN